MNALQRLFLRRRVPPDLKPPWEERPMAAKKGSFADWIKRIEALLQQLFHGQAPALKGAHELAGCGPEECCQAAVDAAVCSLAAALRCQDACRPEPPPPVPPPA